MTQAHHEQRSRSPKGVAAGKPIPLRLSPEERQVVEAMADQECRSLSNMVRMVFLRGLQVEQSE